MSKKLSLEEAQDKIDKLYPNKFKLLNYNGGHKKCNFIWLETGDEDSMFFFKLVEVFKGKHVRFPPSKRQEAFNVRKYTIEEIKEFAKSIGYECLSDEYIHANKRLKWKCNKQHEWFASWSSINNCKNRCAKCSGVSRHELEQVKEKYLKQNLEFLDSSFVNIQKKHNIKCIECNGLFKQSYYGITLRKYGCPYCMGRKRKENNIKKYGVDHPMKTKDIALKAARSLTMSSIKKHWRTNEELVCQASYEVKVVDYLNLNMIDFLWQPETFLLSDGLSYRPDLYLIEKDLWIEIKGYMREDGLKKWNEFHNLIKPNSELWDTKKLKEMKIL